VDERRVEIPEWTPDELRRALEDPGRRVVLLDVRTAAEFAHGSLPGALSMPLDEIDERCGEIPPDAEVVCLCPDGERAAVAVVLLRSLGVPRAALLAGGLRALGLAGEEDEGEEP
jgi:rhodanese-related sulfurtransferase